MGARRSAFRACPVPALPVDPPVSAAALASRVPPPGLGTPAPAWSLAAGHIPKRSGACHRSLARPCDQLRGARRASEQSRPGPLGPSGPLWAPCARDLGKTWARCVGRESNPGQLLGRQLCSPLYHQRRTAGTAPARRRHTTDTGQRPAQPSTPPTTYSPARAGRPPEPQPQPHPRLRRSALSLAGPRAPRALALALPRTRRCSGALSPAGCCNPARQPRQASPGPAPGGPPPRPAWHTGGSGPARRTPRVPTHLEPNTVGLGMGGRGRGGGQACSLATRCWAGSQQKGLRAPGTRAGTVRDWVRVRVRVCAWGVSGSDSDPRAACVSKKDMLPPRRGIEPRSPA